MDLSKNWNSIHFVTKTNESVPTGTVVYGNEDPH